MRRLFLLLLIFCGCGQPLSKPVEIIEVSPHHATRVFVTYKCEDGSLRTETVHRSYRISLGNKTVNPDEYLEGKKPYGPVE